MTICTNCNGGGLIGQGDKPWLKEGHIETCSQCAGTGKIGDDEASNDVAEAPAPAEMTPAQETPVDNSNLSEGSSDGSKNDEVNQESAPVAEPVADATVAPETPSTDEQTAPTE